MPRKRTVEPWEEELRAKARELKEERDIDILRTAAIMLVGRRLEEIRQILASANLNAPSAIGLVHSSLSTNGSMGASQAVAPVEHPCAQCGRAGVKEIPPDGKFVKKAMWLCRIHLPLAVQHSRKPLVEGPQIAPEAPSKPDTGSDVTIKDAFAALGVDEAVQ